jgi:amino acid adenylation domain-containing protein
MERSEEFGLGLSEQKRALLEAMVHQRGLSPAISTDHGIPRRAGGGLVPLSLSQEPLWFLDQLQPGNSSYNIPGCLRLDGALNIPALQQSLEEIVRRHEALRTTVSVEDGKLVQVISPAGLLALPVIDLSRLPNPERNGEALRWASKEAQRPFDLAHGPLLRSTLLRLGETEHLLQVILHHIVADGWSLGVLIREIGALYSAFGNGCPSPLPTLPIQYADFAVWQRQWLQGERLERPLNYWKERLRGLTTLELPTDRPRPVIQSYQGTTHPFELSRELSQALQALSRREGVTLFMTLIGAFQVLLARYSGQVDIALGTPVANRNRPELEGLIGFFVNTVVLRADLSGNPSFREVLKRVREAALGAYAHQDLPFEKLVSEVQPVRDPGRNPLFQVTFALQNAFRQTFKLPGIKVSRVPLQTIASRFDLSVALREMEQGLVGDIEYSLDLFDEATILRLIAHYRRLLEAIVADPAQRIGDLPILAEAERRHVLQEWSGSHADYLEMRCLHQLFEDHADHAPESVAVVCGEEYLSYGELNRRANQVAVDLQDAGVGPEVRVAVYVERSLELVVAILAVLKAGGGYVPLDPAYPRERLALLLEDSRASLVLTQERFLARLPSNGPSVISLDRDWLSVAGKTTHQPLQKGTVDNLAYVIYTSGSTGKPKGCLVTHRNVARLLRATASLFQFHERDVWTMFHSYAFDFSVWELWGALAHGGRLVIVPYLVSRSPHAFYQLLIEQGVTVLNQTPSAFYQLAQAEEDAGGNEPLPLRVVIFGGEVLDVARLRRWLARHGDECPKLINMYGITETTVHVTYRPLTLEDQVPRLGSPIGRPLAGWQVFVLDPCLQPVPVGVPGELYVGGAGLTRGYAHAPDRTAERFLPNPFSAEHGARLYRTGDRARWRPDGDIEFLGRVDEQVKIRGFRIEPGEIEAVLLDHAAVQATVVVVREDNLGDRRLVGYVVPQPGLALAESDLRALAQERLPDYMRPATYVFLAALPLTIHGKLDRKALPTLDGVRRVRETPPIAPRTELEQLLVEIWREVLHLDDIGIEDNLFELGGSSIQAALIVNRLQLALGNPVSLAALFTAPTIAGLCSQLSESAPHGISSANSDRGIQSTIPSDSETPQELLDHLDELSDEEVNTLLGTMSPGRMNE